MSAAPAAGHPFAPAAPAGGVPLVSLVALALHGRQAAGELSAYDRSLVLRYSPFAGFASAAAAAELVELAAACPRRAARARRRRAARRCASTVRAGTDPPPSANDDTPGGAGGVALNIGSSPRVRLCSRSA